MNAHTPGPWRVYTNGNGERRLAIQAGGKLSVETIADIRLKSITDLPAEANAKLMAQAPALLEALGYAATALHDLANPASRSAHAMKRGRQNAKRHESLVRTAISEATK